MYRAFLITLLFLASVLGQNISQQVKNFQQTQALENAQWSVYAKYVENKQEIVSHNPHYSLTPASGLKLFATAAALDILGSDFRFETHIYFDGDFKDGLLDGNLIIIGGGDPTLGSDLTEGSASLDSLLNNWVNVLKMKGLKEVSGDIIAFNGLFDEQAVPGYWFWIDLGNYYAAGSYALNIHDNLYHLFFEPANHIGGSARVLRTEPFIPNLTFDNEMKTGRRGSGDNGYIYCAPKQYHATLRGTIPMGVQEFSIKGSIPDPPLFAAQLLRKTLSEKGIKVNGNARTSRQAFNFNKGHIIQTTYSPPLRNIVYTINKRSNNLYTETVAKMAALKLSGEGSTKAAITAIEKFLDENKIKNEHVNLYDVCGLSPSNTISAKTMVDLLVVMNKNDEFESFYNSLGVAGDPDDPGFFSNWGSGTAMANNARIKSGLINRVRSHSGYVRDKKNRLVAFSMIANNYSGSLRNINNIHKKLIIKLAELK